MILIGATIFLLVVILLSRPVIRLISRPLNANHPLTAQLLRISLWIAVLSVVTWPVVLGPLLFKLNCSYFTKFQAKPIIDARVTGYIDERLSVSEYVENHMDGLFLNKDVEDLVAGRIAFFEMKKIRNGSPNESSMPYLRYSLMEIGTPKCSPKVFGFADGQGLLVTGAPGKCIGIESVVSPISKYTLQVNGDINQSDGTTKIVEKSTDKVVAIFRSFYFSFYGNGSYCPKVDIEGKISNAHLELTKLIFMDAKGYVKQAFLK